jgi:hypothetical protein
MEDALFRKLKALKETIPADSKRAKYFLAIICL